MTYNITRTNGFNLVDLDENVIDTTTISGIGLIGKLTPNYGETQSNNFVHLVENFSNDEFPENPITGQLCYRSDVKSLYLCVNEQSIDKWRKILLIIEQNTQPTATDGILWFNTDTNVLSFYNSVTNKWVSINPNNEVNNDVINKNITSEKLSSGTHKFSIDFSTFDAYRDCCYAVDISVLIREIIDDSTVDYMTEFPDCYFEKDTLLINSKTTYLNSIPTKEIKIVNQPMRNIIGYQMDNMDLDISFTTYGSVLDIVIESTLNRNLSKILCNINFSAKNLFDKINSDV